MIPRRRDRPTGGAPPEQEAGTGEVPPTDEVTIPDTEAELEDLPREEVFEAVAVSEPVGEVVEAEESVEIVAGDERESRGLGAWVRKRAKKVVTKLYESRADDLEERARRVVGTAYRDSADDLEERAVRAMRRAIADEANTIKDVIEHSVQVKQREVRLSLLVLVVASLVYLGLYWLTHR